MQNRSHDAYQEMLITLDNVQSAAWFHLAEKGWTREEIAAAAPGSHTPCDIGHAVRLYADRHCLVVPDSCRRRRPPRERRNPTVAQEN